MGFIRDEAERFFPLLLAGWGIERFVALGHSVGGAMAATCAALYPQPCQALITESAQAFVEDRTRHGIQFAKQQFQAPGQMERLQRYHGDKAPWVLAAWTETWLSETFQPWTLESTVPSIDCPLLVLHGADDEYGSLLHPERIARLATARQRCLILENCHHVPTAKRRRRSWMQCTSICRSITTNGAIPADGISGVARPCALALLQAVFQR